MKLIKTIDEMRAFGDSHAQKRQAPWTGADHGRTCMKDICRWYAAHAKNPTLSRSRFLLTQLSSAPTKTSPNIPAIWRAIPKCSSRAHVDVIFAPSVDDMYPAGAVTWVTVEEMSDRLCGKSRPGHFRGVTTVVAKLFHIIEPDVAFFGQKDAAQVAIIRRMVRDLNMPVAIEVSPIIRESDGLALSSRNAYLNPEERKAALVLHRSLQRAHKLFESGERNSAKLIAAGKQEFDSEPKARLDYFEIVDPDSLESITTISNRALIAVAAFIGNTRLIDNILVDAHR